MCLRDHYWVFGVVEGKVAWRWCHIVLGDNIRSCINRKLYIYIYKSIRKFTQYVGFKFGLANNICMLTSIVSC